MQHRLRHPAAPPPESPERVEALWHQVEREAAPVADPATPAGLPALPSGNLSQAARVVSPENGLIPARSAEEIGEAAAQALNFPAGLERWFARQ